MTLEDMKKYTGVICRGSIRLGSACMQCEKCKDEYMEIYGKELDLDAIEDFRKKKEERFKPKSPPYGMTLEEKIAMLEDAVAPFTGGKVPGTIIGRYLDRRSPYKMILWSLGVGEMGTPLQIFTGETIEVCVDAAIKWVADGMESK